MSLVNQNRELGLLSNVIQAVVDLKDREGSTLNHIVQQVKRNVRGNVASQVQKALRCAVVAGYIKQPKRGRYKMSTSCNLPKTMLEVISQRGRNRKDYCGTCKKGRARRRRRSRSRSRRRGRRSRSCSRRRGRSRRRYRRCAASPELVDSILPTHEQYYKCARYHQQPIPILDKPKRKSTRKKMYPTRQMPSQSLAQIQVCDELINDNVVEPKLKEETTSDDKMTDLGNEERTSNHYVVKDPAKSDHNPEATDENKGST